MARRKARAGGGKGGGGTRGSAARVKRESTRSGDAAAAGSGWTAAAGEEGLRRQLAARGLRIVPIESDGNCLFRALADQLFGGGPNTSGDHVSLRANAVRHMRENADTYSLFLEEDEDFESYLVRMERDGAWGGHLELQALADTQRVQIHVHQPGEAKAWVLGEDGPRVAHVAYVDGEHFHAVRRRDDDGDGPAVHAEAAEADEAWERAVGEVAVRGRVSRAAAMAALAECGGDTEAAVDYCNALGEDADEALLQAAADCSTGSDADARCAVVAAAAKLSGAVGTLRI